MNFCLKVLCVRHRHIWNPLLTGYWHIIPYYHQRWFNLLSLLTCKWGPVKTVRLVMKVKYLGYIKKKFFHESLSKSFKSLETQSLIHEPSVPISLENRDLKHFTHRSRHVVPFAKRETLDFQYKGNHRLLHWSLIMILKIQHNICIEHHALLSPKGSWRAARVWGEPRGWKCCVY